MNKIWVGSPNFTQGRNGLAVQGIVLHWMDGRLASADATFQNRARNTSAHYGLEDGVVHQYVKEEDTAYQAGNWDVNEHTIGIEHSAEPGRSPSDATYEDSAQLIADAAATHGFDINASTIRHHYDVVATQCSGDVANGGVDEARILKRAIELRGTIPAPLPAPIPAPPIVPASAVAGTATVTVDVLLVREQPNHNSALAGSQKLMNGQTFEYVAAVQGEDVGGVTTWLKSIFGHYVWAGGTDYPTTPPVNDATGGLAQVIRYANVRVAPNTQAALGGSQHLTAGLTFEWTAKVHGENVSQNGITTDIWYHSVAGNYVWSGNCKDV